MLQHCNVVDVNGGVGLLEGRCITDFIKITFF